MTAVEIALRALLEALDDALEYHRPPAWPHSWAPNAQRAVRLARREIDRLQTQRLKPPARRARALQPPRAAQ